MTAKSGDRQQNPAHDFYEACNHDPHPNIWGEHYWGWYLLMGIGYTVWAITGGPFSGLCRLARDRKRCGT